MSRGTAAGRQVPTQASVGIGVPLPGMINMGFVDGHVEEVKLQNLWSYYWHVGWVTPAIRPP